eukprot:scaffold15584_cov200-Alexandrium_tamarense.AAC.7
MWIGSSGGGIACLEYTVEVGIVFTTPLESRKQVEWDRGWMYKLVSWNFGCGMRWEEQMIAQNWTLQSVRG